MNNHTNLKIESDHKLEDFPGWFQDAKTLNATVSLSNSGVSWHYGIWKDSVWEKGTWHSGIWKSGTWKSGTWEEGIWQSGIWKNGNWKDGIWKNGTWEDGVWQSGIWKNGNWKDGIWEDGNWKDGTWVKGLRKKVSIDVPSFCKWRIYYRNEAKTIKIGCLTRTIAEWDRFFYKSDEVLETRRDDKAFHEILKSYEIAKSFAKAFAKAFEKFHSVPICKCGKPQVINEMTYEYCGACEDCIPS